MNFRSVVAPSQTHFTLNYTDKSVWLGSCFTEAIGGKALQRKMPALVNPFGNIFNPLALVLHLQRSLQPQALQEEEIVFHNNLWHSWQHHGSKSHENKAFLLKETLENWQKCRLWLKKTQTLFITLGSAWVYEYAENGLLVANCHKVPHNKFRKRLLAVIEITSAFEAILQQWKNVNPRLQVVLTVSPVKHLRDGIIENNRSKAILLLATHTLVEKIDYVNYYPAYELITDDLRDYRFYKEDLAHPNEIAEKYVWEHFCKTYFTTNMLATVKEVETLISGINHKPLHANSQSHQAFLTSLLNKANNLQTLGIDLTQEIEQLKTQLSC